MSSRTLIISSTLLPSSRNLQASLIKSLNPVRQFIVSTIWIWSSYSAKDAAKFADWIVPESPEEIQSTRTSLCSSFARKKTFSNNSGEGWLVFGKTREAVNFL